MKLSKNKICKTLSVTRRCWYNIVCSQLAIDRRRERPAGSILLYPQTSVERNPKWSSHGTCSSTISNTLKTIISIIRHYVLVIEPESFHTKLQFNTRRCAKRTATDYFNRWSFRWNENNITIIAFKLWITIGCWYTRPERSVKNRIRSVTETCVR